MSGTFSTRGRDKKCIGHFDRKSWTTRKT